MQAPGKGKEERGREDRFPACPAARRPGSHSFRAASRWPQRPEPPCTHLSGSTISPRPRPLRPLPGAGETWAGGRPPAGTTGCAGPGRAGGAGRARPSAAGRSRAAAGSDTCRAPLPQPPRPLARRGSGAQPRPRRGVVPTLGAVRAEAPKLLVAQPRRWGKSRAGDPEREAGAAGAAGAAAAATTGTLSAVNWRDLRPGERSALTKRALPSGTRRGGSVEPVPGAPRLGFLEPG